MRSGPSTPAPIAARSASPSGVVPSSCRAAGTTLTITCSTAMLTIAATRCLFGGNFSPPKTLRYRDRELIAWASSLKVSVLKARVAGAGPTPYFWTPYR